MFKKIKKLYADWKKARDYVPRHTKEYVETHLVENRDLITALTISARNANKNK